MSTTVSDVSRKLKIYRVFSAAAFMAMETVDVDKAGSVVELDEDKHETDKTEIGQTESDKHEADKLDSDTHDQDTTGEDKKDLCPQAKERTSKRKHNKKTHVKKTHRIKPRTSNQLKRMFDPTRQPRRACDSSSSSYYTSS